MLVPVTLILALIPSANAARDVAKQMDSAKPKPLSVAQLVEMTLKEGISKPLSLSGDRKLGYEASHPCKKLQYEDKVAGDGFHHRFQVVLSDKGKPRDVIVGKVRTINTADGRHVDSYAYRMDLSGKLIAAIRGAGPPNKLAKEILSVSAPETIAAFKVELDFFKNKAQYLPLAKIE